MTTKNDKSNQSAPVVKLPRTGKGAAIYSTQSELNYKFVTAKKAVQVELSIGKESALAVMLNSEIHVSIKAQAKDGKTVLRDGNLTLAVLLTDAANGFFEIMGTNSNTEKDVIDQWDAQVNGFIYKGDWLASLRKPDFSFPTLYKALTDHDADLLAEYAVTAEQLEQWTVLTSKMTFKEVMGSVRKLHDSALWTWLAAIMDAQGYVDVVDVKPELEELF
jgi:hypothetical protein